MKIKFTLAEILLMCLVSASLFSQNYNYLSDYNSDGVPLDMVNTQISESLVNNIGASLPEGFPVPDYNPEYISDGVDTDVIINQTADVWVSFVGEGAGYRNVLGFYTYDLSNPPSVAPSEEEITIIFPNVSAAGSGGGLITGDKMYLGQYPPGTGIGWVLIANGWNGSSVGYGNWILYSNPIFNPESDYDLQKHNVNLYDGNEQVVVLGFEDIRRDYSSCDQDFNDALFLVTTNPYEAMETSNYNPITNEGGGQSSGNDGGLESNRGISNLVAKRSFDRSLNPEPISSKAIQSRNDHFFDRVVPNSFGDQDRREITSPIDLEEITTADIIWSADYFKDELRYATVFATETKERVYDHTKVVCDRLAGSELLDIREVNIHGNTMLLSSLLTPDKSIEYSISFSLIDESESKIRVSSRWAVDQYDSVGSHYNFQVWSSAPFLTMDIAMEILDNVHQEGIELISSTKGSCLPEVFVEKGSYSGNQIDIIIKNTSEVSKNVNLIGSMTQTEIDEDLELLLKTVTVPPGSHPFTIESLHESLFDLEIKVKDVDSDSYDVAYFSDGAWGLDYNQQLTDIQEYMIEPNEVNSEGYSIARNVSVDFKTDDYVSVYKHMMPSKGVVNLSEFNSLAANLNSNSPVKISLVKKSIDNWSDQYSYVHQPHAENEVVTIPFSYFRNGTNEEFIPDDIQIVVFTIIGESGKKHSLEIDNLQFIESRSTVEVTKDEMMLFPNPTSGLITLQLDAPSDARSLLKIYNVTGDKKYERQLDISRGVNLIKEDISFLTDGIYIVEIANNDIRYSKKVVVKR